MTYNFDDTIAMVKYTNQKDERHLDAIKQFLYLAPHLMFLKDYSPDADGKYVLISREWERTYSMKRDEVLGHTDFELFPKPTADKKRLDDLHTIQFERVVTVVDLNGTRYNSFKPTKMALIPIKVAGEKKFTYIAGMAISPMPPWQE